MLKIICEMSGKKTAFPCSASGCPLFGDCISKYRQLTQKPQTNADRIRAMSDEELFVAIQKTYIGETPWCDHHCKLDDDCSCRACLKEWLQQPAEEVPDNG